MQDRMRICLPDLFLVSVLLVGLSACSGMKGLYYASVYSFDSQLYRYIDDRGNDVFDTEYLFAYDFSEGMALVLLEEDSTWVMIDTKGAVTHTFPDSINALMQPRFNSSSDFNVQAKDSLLTLFHIDGTIYPPRFFYHLRKGVLFNGKNFWSAGNFSEGRCFVQSLSEDKYKMGFIDTSGQFVLEIDSLCSSGDFYTGKSLIFKGLEASYLKG